MLENNYFPSILLFTIIFQTRCYTPEIVNKLGINSDKQLNASSLLKYKILFKNLLSNNNTICYSKKNIFNLHQQDYSRLSGLISTNYYLTGDLNNSYILVIFNDTFDSNYKQSAEKTSSEKATGAKLFIILLMTIYAIITVCILVSKVKPVIEKRKRKHANARTEYLLHNITEQTETRQILNQLRDKRYRERIWSIYRPSGGEGLPTDEDLAAKQSEKERHTLKDIERKISVIKKYERKLEEKSIDYLDLKKLSDLRKASLQPLETLKSQVGVHKREQQSDEPSKLINNNNNNNNTPLRVRFRENAELVNVLREWRASNFKQRIISSSFKSNNKPGTVEAAKREEKDSTRVRAIDSTQNRKVSPSHNSYYFTVAGSSFHMSDLMLKESKQSSGVVNELDAQKKGRFRVSKADEDCKQSEMVPLMLMKQFEKPSLTSVSSMMENFFE